LEGIIEDGSQRAFSQMVLQFIFMPKLYVIETVIMRILMKTIFSIFMENIGEKQRTI